MSTQRSWLTGWSESFNKRLCRFLIHRYLGHVLKERLSLEQLTVDLFDGTGRITDVNIDAQVRRVAV
jgi:autophagy-related protein 2